MKARHQAAAKAREYEPSIPIEQPAENNSYEKEG
ncbi:hypothetical protein AHiyo8_01900 [Arthrobacter sp. Hiyo8]|nr:hypothetical protein AHiyo8_01900 [Arthrobacter sp. Hiyo8]